MVSLVHLQKCHIHILGIPFGQVMSQIYKTLYSLLLSFCLLQQCLTIMT